MSYVLSLLALLVGTGQDAERRGPTCNAQPTIESAVIAAMLRCESDHLLFPEYKWVLASDVTNDDEDPRQLRVQGETTFVRTKGKRVRYAQPDDLKRFWRSKAATMMLSIHLKRSGETITGYFSGTGLSREGYLNVLGGVQDPTTIVKRQGRWECAKTSASK